MWVPPCGRITTSPCSSTMPREPSVSSNARPCVTIWNGAHPLSSRSCGAENCGPKRQRSRNSGRTCRNGVNAVTTSGSSNVRILPRQGALPGPLLYGDARPSGRLPQHVLIEHIVDRHAETAISRWHLGAEFVVVVCRHVNDRIRLDALRQRGGGSAPLAVRVWPGTLHSRRSKPC